MRLHFGPIPDTAEVSPEEGWVPSKEPPAWLVVWVLSLPAAALLAFAATVSVIRYTEISIQGMSLSGLLLVYAALVPVHELVHAAFHPDRGLSKNTVLGFWPASVVFFAHYEGQRTRGGFMLGLLAPFLFLSLALMAVSGALGWSSWIAGAVIILNAAVSSADVLGAAIVAFVVPAGSVVRNKGWYTYWKMKDAAGEP